MIVYVTDLPSCERRMVSKLLDNMSHIIPPRNDYHLLSRKQQVILARLRTGHNRLNSHMHGKLKQASSPTCHCGQEDQTTEHVLQRCPLHKATREDVWPVNTLLKTKLFGCKQELEKTSGPDRVDCERQEEDTVELHSQGLDEG